MSPVSKAAAETNAIAATDESGNPVMEMLSELMVDIRAGVAVELDPFDAG